MSEYEKAAALCRAQLWADFKAATETDASGRGLFLRIGDDAARVRCVFAAVSRLVVPLVVEVARLRAEVADMKRRSP